MSDPELKPTQRPEFKQAMKTAIIVLAVAAVVILITVLAS